MERNIHCVSNIRFCVSRIYVNKYELMKVTLLHMTTKGEEPTDCFSFYLRDRLVSLINKFLCLFLHAHYLHLSCLKCLLIRSFNCGFFSANQLEALKNKFTASFVSSWIMNIFIVTIFGRFLKICFYSFPNVFPSCKYFVWTTRSPYFTPNYFIANIPCCK